jgi:hypothetical protein
MTTELRHTENSTFYISAHTVYLPHVRVCVANYLLYLSDMTDFEGNETLENRILNFIGHFLRDFFYYWFPQ